MLNTPLIEVGKHEYNVCYGHGWIKYGMATHKVTIEEKRRSNAHYGWDLGRRPIPGEFQISLLWRRLAVGHFEKKKHVLFGYARPLYWIASQ